MRETTWLLASNYTPLKDIIFFVMSYKLLALCPRVLFFFMGIDILSIFGCVSRRHNCKIINNK